jgi:hypothetical protein
VEIRKKFHNIGREIRYACLIYIKQFWAHGVKAAAADLKSAPARGLGSSPSVPTKSMISPYSKCLRKLKVGDEVLVKLLPYRTDFKTFKDPILFPVIGFNQYAIPLIGTMNMDYYNNHHFITTKLYSKQLPVTGWTYCLRLDSDDIEIQRIIKYHAISKSAHLQR